MGVFSACSLAMPRACVIVLDAVGAGDLPDAADYGSAGSNTLAHVAEAVGGLGTSRPGVARAGQHRGHPWRDSAARRARRLGSPLRAQPRHGHHHRALGDDGHRHRARVPDVPARVPAVGDRRVRPEHGPRGARQLPGVRHRDHQRAGRGAPAHRQLDRLHVRRQRVPDRGARADDPAGGAVRGLPHGAGDADRRERRRPRDRQAVRGHARPLRAHAAPPRLLPAPAAAQLPASASARRGWQVHGVGKISDIFAGQDMDSSTTTGPTHRESRSPRR